MYWTMRVFGDSSETYLSTLPNEYVWDREETNLRIYSDYYLRHPAFRDYPVVGITQKQAERYCQWRSDRVFEYFLIKQKILDYNLNQNEDSYFSIEKYFAGHYFGIKPNPKIKHYPNYKLPSENEWIQSKKYFDSIYSRKMNKNKIVFNITPGLVKISGKEQIRAKKNAFYKFQNIDHDSLMIEPFSPVNNLNMSGNASEWISESNFIIGGSWKDNTSVNFQKKNIALRPSCTIGFRCACEILEFKMK